MDVLDISKKILHEGPICDNCLGRQFAKLSTGLSNRERGQALKLALVLEGDRIYKAENDDSLLKELAPCSAFARKSLGTESEDEQCWVCLDQFKKLDEWADEAFFRLYRHLSGMTGTANEAGSELWHIYKLPVLTIPTNRP